MKLNDLRGKIVDQSIVAELPRPEIDTNAAVEVVRPLLDRVRHQGARALYELDEEFDHILPPSLKVPATAIAAALDELDPKVRAALEEAIAHTRLAHLAQLPTASATEVVPGGFVFQRWVPLRRVGLYVPGGLAVYPSSVVMNVVTAQVAGVDSIVVASPPQAQFGGLPHPTILAACALLGIDEIIAVGGAQAIGAMAYGFTDGDYTCEPVDKVAGPGNVYVAAAKRCVQEVCGIDAEAGTTEIAILADSSADPRYVAADLISQAEHDPAAGSILVTDSPTLAEAVEKELPALIEGTQHRERINTALNGSQSGIVLVDNLDAGTAFIEAYSPEHLEVITVDAPERAFSIRNAGAIFVGEYSPVPLGDYLAGSNHVLPTGGTARYASGLNVTQYLRSVQVIDYNRAALAQVTDSLLALASAEGLPAHGQAAEIRREGQPTSCAADKAAATTLRLPWRKELAEVEPYGAPQLDVPVRLNVNENPYAPTQAVIQSVVESVQNAMQRLNRYADRDARELRQSLADYLRDESRVNLQVDQIWAANGSNEIMLQLLQAFGGPGRIAMGVAPTYSMYQEYARDTNTDWVCLDNPSDDLFAKLNVSQVKEGLQRYRPAVIFLPNPNNPTGSSIGLESIKEILAYAETTGPLDEAGRPTATLIVVDEAYGEFRPENVESATTLLADYPHLIVTRTMSKAFAAAGLRLGYVAADSQIIREIQKVRLPYHLSLITQAAAMAALKHAETQMRQVALLCKERDDLAAWLKEEGFQVADSAANFLLFGPFKDREQIWQDLLDRGVLIRNVGPKGCLRVTVGTPEENLSFRQALVEVTS